MSTKKYIVRFIRYQDKKVALELDDFHPQNRIYKIFRYEPKKANGFVPRLFMTLITQMSAISTIRRSNTGCSHTMPQGRARMRFGAAIAKIQALIITN